PREGREASNALDLLGRESQQEQVADRLLESGEDEVGPMRRKPPDKKLERGLLPVHTRSEVAGHHRELIEVGDRAEGVPLGPERHGRTRAHGVFPLDFGRSRMSGASTISEIPDGAAPGSTSSNVGKVGAVGYSATGSQRSSSLAVADLMFPSCLNCTVS